MPPLPFREDAWRKWYRLGESRRGVRGERGGRSKDPPLLLLFSLLFLSWRHGGRGKFSGQSDRDATLLLDDPYDTKLCCLLLFAPGPSPTSALPPPP